MSGNPAMAEHRRGAAIIAVDCGELSIRRLHWSGKRRAEAGVLVAGERRTVRRGP